MTASRQMIARRRKRPDLHVSSDVLDRRQFVSPREAVAAARRTVFISATRFYAAPEPFEALDTL
jgi:hypothetical protein